MASGRDHDRATRLGWLPMTLLLGLGLGWPAGVAGGLAWLIGGLWLSPDLDTRSRALRRWGPLQGLWWPYRRLIPHRSFFSHGPLIGMALRLIWLLAVLLLLWQGLVTLPMLAIAAPEQAVPRLVRWLMAQPRLLIAVLLGLEASVWLHLILDGDPMPAEWSRRWRRRRRR